MTLYPKLYENGWAGGYGGYSAYDPDGLFYIENVTISGVNLTIREILNQLARENGNALWVVKLEPGELDRDAPYWKGQPLNASGHSPLNHRWQFIPLADLSRLANERVTLQLTIDGFFTARQFVFPVIMEHSLGRTAGAGNGIFSSAGTYCSYSIAVKEVRPN